MEGCICITAAQQNLFAPKCLWGLCYLPDFFRCPWRVHQGPPAWFLSFLLVDFPCWGSSCLFCGNSGLTAVTAYTVSVSSTLCSVSQLRCTETLTLVTFWWGSCKQHVLYSRNQLCPACQLIYLEEHSTDQAQASYPPSAWFGNCPLKGFSRGFPVCSCLTCLCTVLVFPQGCPECMVISGTRRPPTSLAGAHCPELCCAVTCWAPSMPHAAPSPPRAEPPPSQPLTCCHSQSTALQTLFWKYPKSRCATCFPLHVWGFFVGIQKQWLPTKLNHWCFSFRWNCDPSKGTQEPLTVILNEIHPCWV